MKVLKIQSNKLDESLVFSEVKFSDLISAANNHNFDFVVNPVSDNRIISLPKPYWLKLYDIVFDTNNDSFFTPAQFESELKLELAFSKRYRCV